MARFGRNEQLVIGGAAVALIAYLIGVVSQSWPINASALSIMIGSLVALAMVVTGGSRTVAGLPGPTLVRIAAAIVGAFALVDLGDLISSVSQWETVTLVLTILYVAGAVVLAFGAWAASGGSLITDLGGVARVMRLSMIDRLVYLGAGGVIVSWFLLMAIADIYVFTTEAQLAVLAAVLVLVVRWLDRNPSAGRLPVAAPWATAGLAAVAVLLGAWWFIRVIGRTLDVGDLSTYVPLVIYLIALVALAVGGFLGIGVKAPQGAA